MTLTASMMAPHELRVATERADLDGKIAKLVAFVVSPAFEDVNHDEKQRLHRQVRIMCDYREVLDECIAAFEVPHA